MKLRTVSKRKPTEELILFKEQAISTKRAKTQPQHDIGYSLRSKPEKTWRHLNLPTEAKKSSQTPQTRVMSRCTAAEPMKRGMVPVLQRGRSTRLSKQMKCLKPLQKLTPYRKQASAVLPARRSLRIGTKCKLELAREPVMTKRSMRRLIVRMAALPTCDGSRRKRGDLAPLSWTLHSILQIGKWLRSTSFAGKTYMALVLLAGGQAATLPETMPDDSLTDHCEPTATGILQSEIKEHQAVDGKVAGEQGMEDTQQAQEPVEEPMHQQEEHANPGPANVSDAAADPEDTLAADERQISPSMVSEL